MAHTLVSLEKLGNSDLARLVMGYQNKFDTALNNINPKLLDLKNKFKDMVRIMNKKKSLKNANLDVQVFPQALHYSLILAFAVIISTCGPDAKHYGLVN